MHLCAGTLFLKAVKVNNVFKFDYQKKVLEKILTKYSQSAYFNKEQKTTTII